MDLFGGLLECWYLRPGLAPLGQGIAAFPGNLPQLGGFLASFL
jgi:hypothetical protein